MRERERNVWYAKMLNRFSSLYSMGRKSEQTNLTCKVSNSKVTLKLHVEVILNLY